MKSISRPDEDRFQPLSSVSLRRLQATIPDQWVVDCKRVGNGDKALIYLGRYLYRGVLPEKGIVGIQGRTITFRFADSSGASKTRTLGGADFLWLLMQHVLPRGFRRTRDYGFLHANAKKIIRIVQRVFRIPSPAPNQRSPLCCKECGSVLRVTVFPKPRKPPHRIDAVMEGIA